MSLDYRATVTFKQTTDAEFRAWVAEVIAQWLAVGLTQTGDTGQINTTTVTRPGVSNTVAGYAIFRFNDSLQSTRPIFFKIEFGTGGAVTVPGIWLTLGTGSDGAGNLTNVVMVRTQLTSTAGTVNGPMHACYNTAKGMFWTLIETTAQSSTILFIIHRTCDDTGAADNRGAFFHKTTAGQRGGQVAWADNVERGPNVIAPYAVPWNTSSPLTYHKNARPATFVCTGYLGSGEWYTLPGILGLGKQSDYPHAELVTVAPFGTDITYRSITGSTASNVLDAGATASSSLLMLWE